MSLFPLFVSCSRGVEPLLVQELSTLGASEVREARGGVSCQATLETAYRACLWSRLASRVLMPLQTVPFAVPATAETADAADNEAPAWPAAAPASPPAASNDAQAIYDGARQIAWTDLFDAGSSFAIEVAGRTPGIANTHFAGLKVKDAIVDSFRDAGLERPNVDLENPAIRIHLHMDRKQASLSLDLAGDSLHRRGYRARGVEAPLKENLAAAILVRAGWPELAANEDAPLLDPMCGSGTLLIEGAWMAADVAPGMLRTRWGFEAWLDHKPVLWKRLREEALERREAGVATLKARFHGRDLDPRAVTAARSNAERAGLADKIRVEVGDAILARPPASAWGSTPGLVVSNPPYGERLGADPELIKLYSLFGVTMKTHFAGWRFAWFTARDDLAPRLGLRAEKISSLYNGAIACKLLRFEVGGGKSAVAPAAAAAAGAEPVAAIAAARPEVADEIRNRLRKNARHLAKWAKRAEVGCYRVYDADLPEYAVAVDLYTTLDGSRHAHVQEYAAPKSVDPIRVEKRLRSALAAVQEELQIAPAHLHYKLRQSQKGTSQYQRQADTEARLTVLEHGCKLQVNFDDYLDTGLFLDHRPMRLRLQREAAGKRVLNLFCYTGAASVHAAVGGAAQTVSIDLSNTYLEWAQRNLLLNDIHSRQYDRPPPSGERLPQHVLFRADCLQWLDDEARLTRPLRFDLIFLDPPTFSNSKKMEATLDIQRDHPKLVGNAMALLAPGGTLYFSSNRRGFKLDPLLAEHYEVRDITAQTLDEDFKRPPPAHKAWAIRHRM